MIPNNRGRHGKRKIFLEFRTVATIITTTKKDSAHFANENKSSDKSDRSLCDASLDPLSKIKNLKLRNVNKVIIDNIDTNSLPKKFEQLKELVMKYIDFLVITKTKLDDSFPTSQFLMKGTAEPQTRSK